MIHRLFHVFFVLLILSTLPDDEAAAYYWQSPNELVAEAGDTHLFVTGGARDHLLLDFDGDGQLDDTYAGSSLQLSSLTGRAIRIEVSGGINLSRPLSIFAHRLGVFRLNCDVAGGALRLWGPQILAVSTSADELKLQTPVAEILSCNLTRLSHSGRDSFRLFNTDVEVLDVQIKDGLHVQIQDSQIQQLHLTENSYLSGAWSLDVSGNSRVQGETVIGLSSFDSMITLGGGTVLGGADLRLGSGAATLISHANYSGDIVVQCGASNDFIQFYSADGAPIEIQGDLAICNSGECDYSSYPHQTESFGLEDVNVAGSVLIDSGNQCSDIVLSRTFVEGMTKVLCGSGSDTMSINWCWFTDLRIDLGGHTDNLSFFGQNICEDDLFASGGQGYDVVESLGQLVVGGTPTFRNFEDFDLP